jgi:hypothetical protein
MAKARFENNGKGREICMIKEPFGYVISKACQKPAFDTQAGMLQRFIHKTYWEYDAKTKAAVEKRFIMKWIRDAEKKTYEAKLIDPSRSVKGVYNLWRGFVAESLPAPASEEAALAAFKPFYEHILHVYCNDVKEHAAWFVEWYANIVQHPEHKSGVCIVLFGTMGCGKGMLNVFFREKILGTHCSIKSENFVQDFIDSFANGLDSNVFALVDELGNVYGHTDRIKDIISDSKYRLELKGRDKIEIPNLCSFIITTNNKQSVAVTTDDRRTVMVECNSDRTHDIKYIQGMGAYLKRPETAAGVYYVLKNMVDLSKYYCGKDSVSFDNTKPRTEFYKEIQGFSIPIMQLFMSALINANTQLPGNGEISYSPQWLLEQYVAFGKNEKGSFSSSQKAFGSALRPFVDGGVITKDRTAGGYVYKFSFVNLKNYLIAKRQYEGDAFLPTAPAAK